MRCVPSPRRRLDDIHSNNYLRDLLKRWCRHQWDFHMMSESTRWGCWVWDHHECEKDRYRLLVYVETRFTLNDSSEIQRDKQTMLQSFTICLHLRFTHLHRISFHRRFVYLHRTSYHWSCSQSLVTSIELWTIIRVSQSIFASFRVDLVVDVQ